MNLENLESAILDFTSALDVDSKFVEARFNRAYCLYENRDFEIAIKDFDRVIKESIDFANAFFYRGMAKVSINLFETSCQDIRKASDLGHMEAEMASEIFCN